MWLDIVRLWHTEQTASSILLVDGSFQCYALEPFPPNMPKGIFDVTIRYSPKHGCDLPHIENVPGHTDDEIHIGNFRKDTAGCILPGTERSKDAQGEDDVLHSADAFGVLFAKMQDAKLRGEKIELRVREGYENV